MIYAAGGYNLGKAYFAGGFQAIGAGIPHESEKVFTHTARCEIDDALKKLERFELVTREGDVLQCRPLAEAKKRLDHTWDNYFRFNHS